MYLDFLVNIPITTGKITYRTKGNTDYVYYEYKRIYKKGSNITNPKRVTIGKRDKTDPSMMLPNENYLKYFPDEDLPELRDRTKRLMDFVIMRSILPSSQSESMESSPLLASTLVPLMPSS